MNLCQGVTASCGACCGLYNRSELDAGALRAELRRRTRALAGTARTREAFRAAGRSLSAGGPPPLFPSVRVCPLLGFLDEAERRIGCLAHPAATGGPDLRDCGAYDSAICETFLCPSFSSISEEETELAEEATADWHLYGLVVTDLPFLRATLGAIAGRVGRRVEPRHLRSEPFRAALRRLLAMKEELEPGSEGLFGAFAGGERAKEAREERTEAPQGALDAILSRLGADALSGNDLDALEAEVRRRLGACVRTFPA